MHLARKLFTNTAFEVLLEYAVQKYSDLERRLHVPPDKVGEREH